MEAGELAAVVISVSAAIAVVGLLFTFASIIRAMSVFRKSVEDITRHTLPLISDTHTAVNQANADLRKVDGILDTADSISSTVDTASRLAYTAFASPLVKVLALGSGTARAVGRLRSRKNRLPARRAPRELGR